MTNVVLDMKKVAQDTTLGLHLKIKNLKWFQRRAWVVALFAKLTYLVLGSKVDVDVDYIYDPAE